MIATLISALEAVDRLNSWVRSPSFFRGLAAEGLRRRIYAIKGQAIQRAHGVLACTYHPLTTLATCRDCAGTGKYTDSYGTTYPHCRACGNSGVVRLHFVDTLIAFYPLYKDLNPAWHVHWHSPRDRWPLRSDLLGTEITDVDWKVNQPGKDLTVNEAARDLLLCDETFPGRHCFGGRCSCAACYRLHIGRVEDRCAHCGATVTQEQANHGRLGARSGRAEFTCVACPACYQAKGNSAALFAVGLPPELLEPEHVRAWVEKSGQIQPCQGRVA